MNNLQEQYYTLEYVNFELKEETKVVITSKNYWYDEIKVGSFDFLNGYGWYYTKDKERIDVQRVSTILNYLFKNGMTLWSDKEIKEAKENARKIKYEEKKAYKQDLKQRDEQKAIEMLEGIKNHEERYIKACENVRDYDNDKVYEMTVNTFKYASKKTINIVYEAITNYNNVYA